MGWETGVRFLYRKTEFSVFDNVQTSSEPYTVSYSVGDGSGIFCGGVKTVA
jgi:hypothetical protein